jgi:hypothetical protein
MTRTAIIALIAGGLLAASVPARAHHSFAGYYIEKDTVEIEGDVVQFQFKNPHSYLFVEAQDAFGQRHVYSAEWTAVSRLEEDGITDKTLKPGERVRIWGSPGRNVNEYRIRLKRIRFEDGRMWGGNREAQRDRQEQR